MASTYLTVRGDIRADLSSMKVFIIAEKFLASLFRQSFVLAKVIDPKISVQDAACSFVILLATKRPRQVEVRKSCRPFPTPTLSLDECKAAKPVVDVKPVLDFKFCPVALWNFDCAHLSRKVTGLCPEFAVKLWQHPKEPIQIQHNNLWQGLAPIFAERQYAPRHSFPFRR
jgi:hypothetical protein